MPTYSYRCTECGNAFDIKQSFSDATLTECPACGGVLRKVFSPVGVTFNGGGFYRTDSRPAPKTSDSSGSSSGSSSSGSSSSAGSSSSGSAGSTGSTGSAAKSGSKPSASKPAAS
ncbi:FmdB family zinc ribbon protein [Curtobacterium pusillum]|uniref:FmdB family regulatory protein n=1 Tax=Curtobacterium pusillum TaxID=69373 RepID=A0AAW3SXN2_9MICO|nr:FmdB family zinc ribbon protein [Curtobacterium pusillum]MBA8988796.1 putative FmdB family regulatory protein [Curtobacterium pusillum]NUU13550.1 FmdB family transcriptional regulator [Curtobacterium pusillum]